MSDVNLYVNSNLIGKEDEMEPAIRIRDFYESANENPRRSSPNRIKVRLLRRSPPAKPFSINLK